MPDDKGSSFIGRSRGYNSSKKKRKKKETRERKCQLSGKEKIAKGRESESEREGK